MKTGQKRPFSAISSSKHPANKPSTAVRHDKPRQSIDGDKPSTAVRNDNPRQSNGGNVEKASEPKSVVNTSEQDVASETGLKKPKGAEHIQKKEHEEKKHRYILYVTNVPYDATKEDLTKHFGFLKDKLLSIRMLTDKGTGQFRGTCFVDCADKESFAAALKLHHTKILGRKIVVEPTVGGGGKGLNRMKKLNNKKQKFSDARKKRIAKDQTKKEKMKTQGGGNKSLDSQQ